MKVNVLSGCLHSIHFVGSQTKGPEPINISLTSSYNGESDLKTLDNLD
jgi:hypothetical protein